MISIVVKEDKKINSITITGHSGYEESGKDIICASVSSMVITTVNAIIRIDSEAISYKSENGICITFLKNNEIVDKLADNLLDLLQELEKQYPKNIKIRRC